MIRQASNLGWKALVLCSAVYGTIQLCSYFKSAYSSHIGAESRTPVVDTLDDTARKVGGYMKGAGDAVSGSVENCRPYLENLEEMVIENGGEIKE